MTGTTNPMQQIPFFVENGTPSYAAYALSFDQVVDAIGGIGDEEATTHAFSGSLLTNFRWASVYCQTPSEVEECGWIHYSKYGKGHGSEQDSGSDFGLVLKHSEKDVRVAVFQAKNGHANGQHQYFVDIRRDTKNANGKDIPQIQAMIEQGGRIMNDVSSIAYPAVDRGLLDWMHYLGYFQDQFVAVPLSKLTDDEVNDEFFRPHSFTDIAITDENHLGFGALLLAGLAPTYSPGSGWYSMSQVQFEKHLPNLVRLAQFYVVEERRKGGRHLTPLKGLRCTHKVIDRRSPPPSPPSPGRTFKLAPPRL